MSDFLNTRNIAFGATGFAGLGTAAGLYELTQPGHRASGLADTAIGGVVTAGAAAAAMHPDKIKTLLRSVKI